MLAMKRCTFFLFHCAFALPLLSQTASDQAPSPRLTVQQSLAISPNSGGTDPNGWFINPAGTVQVDKEIVHGGSWSARFDRDAARTDNFSVISKNLPVDFTGGTVELRGFLRTKNVIGFADLYIREDGERGVLQFKGMDDQHIDGTRDWAEFSVSIPIAADARQLQFGALLSGTGTMWADDLRLLVDGKPIAEAKPFDRPLTVLDTDHEFDKGSRLQLSSLTPIQIDNLVTLGRVWGFLKYHHPAVTSGKRQWDYELLRILPAILSASDSPHANDVLVHWIDSLGEVPACQAEQCSPAPAKDAQLKPDVDWIRDRATLGADLSLSLQRIYQNRPRSTQFYVSLAPGVGNPNFDHELTYSAANFPDPGFQLLALFRWWNMMQYWSPYRVNADQNWPAVLAEFIPKLALAKDRTDYQLAMFELVAMANDTHANLWSTLDARPPVGKCTLPVDLRFLDGQAVITGLSGKDPAATSALHIGDIIDELDGTPVSKLTTEWTPYYADSNAAARRRDMALTLTRGDCKPVHLKIRRDSRVLELDADRLPRQNPVKPQWHDLPGETFQLLSPEVAYLKLSSIKVSDVPGYMERAAKTRGLIIDIRNYPSEFMPFALGSYFVSTHTAFATFTIADLANPGAFSFGSPVAIDPASTHYAGKIVILIDESSLSQAEYTAMAFRSAPNAVIVGSTTAGADGNVSQIPLPGGLSTMISGIGVYYPDRAPTQRIGIVPDIKATPTLAGIKAGRDEVLETAIREILGPQIPEATIEEFARPRPQPQPASTR
jgi:C-terminal processing protease CtpA/Prc